MRKKHTLLKFNAANYDPVSYTDKGYFLQWKAIDVRNERTLSKFVVDTAVLKRNTTNEIVS